MLMLYWLKTKKTMTRLSETLIMIVGIAFIIINSPLFLLHMYQEQNNAITDFEKEVAFERVVYGFINAGLLHKLVVTLCSLAAYVSCFYLIKTYIPC
jgi:hypothetical protein